MRPGSEAMMVISSSSSDWTWTNEDTSPVSSLIQSLLGIYFRDHGISSLHKHRTGKLYGTWKLSIPGLSCHNRVADNKNTPENAMRILQSLSKSVDFGQESRGAIAKGQPSNFRP
ncbi:hypothetical protein CK203_110905 [Vitis vinifera]|uniref:Uncharacterized protein n=1 Tax=Vitis vinifera TaxID=29760 RepID=A0A438CEB4_VITVI|nr:hypothetical protein CK203_110905 [Vitis vinifera]